MSPFALVSTVRTVGYEPDTDTLDHGASATLGAEVLAVSDRGADQAYRRLSAAASRSLSVPSYCTPPVAGVSPRALLLAFMRMFVDVPFPYYSVAQAIVVRTVVGSDLIGPSCTGAGCGGDGFLAAVAELSTLCPDYTPLLRRLLEGVGRRRNLADCFAVSLLDAATYTGLAADAEPAGQFHYWRAPVLAGRRGGRVEHFRYLRPRYEPPLSDEQSSVVETLLLDWRGSMTEAVDTARLLCPSTDVGAP